mgnify:CR=1 FL=1
MNDMNKENDKYDDDFSDISIRNFDERYINDKYICQIDEVSGGRLGEFLYKKGII